MNKLTLPIIAAIASFDVFAEQQNMDDFFSMSPAELANISVTIATGTAKPSYKSAAITTVITAEQIKTMGATELLQVLETVPGMHVSIQSVTNDAMFNVRGMRNGVNAQVLVLLNGTRYSLPYKGSSMTGMDLPVEAIKRIEVIRGPGSALYGADAFAGVINIITKKAKDIDGTQLGVRAGSWDTQSAWGLHSNQWLGWDVAATLQYSHNNNDGDRIIDSDLQSQFDTNPFLANNASLAPAEMQTHAERWNAHLNLQRQYWDIGFWAFNEVDGGLRAGAGGALDDKGSLDGESYLADIRFSTENLFKKWELSAHASYLYTNIDADIRNFPGGTILPIDNNGNINLTTPFLLNPTLFPDGHRSHLSIENQVTSFKMGSIYKGFENHLLKLSTEFRYEQVRTKESRNFGKGITNIGIGLTDVTGTEFVFLPHSHRTIFSIALQDEWQLHPDWLLTAGIRYDEYSDFGSTFNPRIALIWEINQQLSSKLLYGRAFRAPSFLEQRQQNSQLFIGNPNLKPETIDTIELAFDYRPVDKLRTAINFYYYKIDDLITNQAIQNNTILAGNLKGQTGYGSEFEWDWQFHEQWNLKGNYAWQCAKNEQTKERVAGVPEHQVYLAMAWQFLPQWQLQTQLNWIGHRSDTDNTTNQDLNNYETVDLTLNSKRFFNVFDLSASVRNAFDRKGKEPSTSSYQNNLPIPSRSFYFETNLYF